MVKLQGTVKNFLPQYTSESGNIFKIFYITDGYNQVRIFCHKDSDFEISENDIVGLSGKFGMFDKEFQISDLECSAIEKK